MVDGTTKFKPGDHMFLIEIQIDAPYQGKGIGTQLIKKVINEAKVKDLPLRLQVLKENDKARKLYLRLGFRQVSETETHIVMEI